jgi:hypothetical protein
LEEAVGEAKENAREKVEGGIDQAALDAAAAKGFDNGEFDFDDDLTDVMEEFYPTLNQAPQVAADATAMPGLWSRMQAVSCQVGGTKSQANEV